MFRSRWLCVVFAVLCLVALAPWSRAEAKVGKSVIVGGIRPCSGLPPPVVKNLPRYAAGTVFVLKGRISRTSEGGLSVPKHVVAKQTVGINATYRIAVFPGHYVLAARLPHSNVGPLFVQVYVREGATVQANVTVNCK